ncbi:MULTISPECIES: hypothetical protein [unclassified Wolbachia]|uniref:Uncharacterized protein n=1 Tax=Wolbachia endosymbiont of Polyergus mexicanus TaxID=3171167 RepID=A0AAU7YL23_9RICK|nr:MULTISPECIES: hypothetical protein [unclassified Wolbachia]
MQEINELPVISSGFLIPSSCKIVGAISDNSYDVIPVLDTGI